MKIARSHAVGIVVLLFLLVLLMWARYLRGLFGW
jgi:hypothetical protein